MERKVFTPEILESINTMAIQCGYNRTLRPGFSKQLPDRPLVPIFTMLHEHKACKPCEPHVRCVFRCEQGTFMLDVEMGCWNLLPTVSSVLEPRNTPEPVTSES